MNFLGIGGLELVLIGIVAFLVVGPKRLSEGARTAAKMLSELRRQRDELTGMVREAVDPEVIETGMHEYRGATSVPRPQDTRKAGPADAETGTDVSGPAERES